MELNIGIIDIKESNEFLRSLWAEIANEFGKCAWAYMPHKNTQAKRIYFGYMSIGQQNLGVSISYREKGSIINLYFDYQDTKMSLELESPLGQQLKRVVKNARKNVGNYKKFLVTEQIQSYHPLSNYETEHFRSGILTNEVTEISFPILAYDENQCSGLAFQKLNQIMDFLSVETNAPFWRNSPKIKGNNITALKKEIYQIPDFIDEISLQNDCLVISEKGKKFIDLIINNSGENEELNKFLSACNLFHTARKNDAQIFDYKRYKQTLSEDGSLISYESYTKDKELETAYNKGASHTEIASTLYLSALEVITLIGFEEEKCPECGQPKYSIKKRVKDIVSEHLNPYLAKTFSNYYDKRSAYLHKGYILTNPTPSRMSIPLLDNDDETGCNAPIKVSVNNLREYTSYILRKFYKKIFGEFI